jgi:hypothetical protein
MEFTEEIKELARRLRFKEDWVSPVGGWTVSVTGGVVGLAAAPFTPLPWYGIFLLPCVMAVGCLFAWYALRELYWRWGSRRKIGLCFDGHKTPPDDWVEVRTELARMFANSQLDSMVCIKVFPPSMIATDPSWERTEKKYKLT